MNAPTWAREDDVKAGDTLIADGGFTCIKEGARLVVKADDRGKLFVPCRGGGHHLDGQLDEGDVYIGFTKAES